MKGRLSLLLLLVGLSVYVQAATRIAASPRTRRFNQTSYETVEATFEFTQFDFDNALNFQVDTASGDTVTMQVTCATPERRYIVSKWGEVPDDGELFISQAWAVRAAQNFVSRNSTNELTASMSRKLLSVPGLPEDCDQCINPGYPGSITFEETKVLCHQFVTSSTPARQNHTITFEECVRGPNFDVYNSLQTKLGDYINTTNQLKNANNNFETSYNNSLNAIEVLRELFTNQSLIADMRLQNIRDQINLTDEKISATKAIARTYFENFSARLASENNLIANATSEMLRFANRSSQNAAYLQWVMGETFGEAMNQLGDTFELIYRNRATSLMLNRQAELHDLDALTALSRYNRDVDRNRQHAKIIHQRLRAAQTIPNSRGRLLYPFLEDTGVAPINSVSDLNPSEIGAFVDEKIFRTVVTEGASVFGVVTMFREKCDIMFLNDGASVSPSVLELMDNIGPPNCDETFTSADTRKFCRCAIFVTESRCLLASGNSTIIGRFDTTGMTLDATTGCASPGSTYSFPDGGLDGIVIKTLSSFVDVMYVMHRRSGVSSFPIIMQNTFSALAYEIPFSQAIYAGNVTLYDLLLSSNDNVTANAAFYYWMSAVNSYTVVRDNLEKVTQRIDGVLPDNMSSRRLGSVRFEGGRSGKGTEYAFALFSDQFLTVSQMTADEVVATVTVTVTGGSDPSIPTNNIVTDVVLSNPYTPLLPGVAPILWNPTQYASVAYDFGKSELSITGFSGVRENHVTYAATDSGTAFTRDRWQKMFRRTFNHYAASNFAWVQKVQLDSNASSPTYGACITAPVSGRSQGHCALRERFVFVPLGIFNDYNTPGTFVLTSRHDKVVAQVSFPSGVIKEVVSSACPIAERLQASLSRLIVTLTNPLAQNNLIQIEQVGACPSTKLVTLPARSVLNVDVERCANPPTPLDQMRFYAYNNESQLELCPSTIAINATALEVYQFNGTITFQAANVVQTAVVDRLRLFIFDVIDNLFDQQQAITLHTLNTQIEYGYKPPNATLNRYTDIISRISAIREELPATSVAAREAIAQKVKDSQAIDKEFGDAQRRAEELAAASAANLLAINVTLDGLLLDTLPRLYDAASVLRTTLVKSSLMFKYLVDGWIQGIGIVADNRCTSDRAAPCYANLVAIQPDAAKITCDGVALQASRLFGNLSEGLSQIFGGSCTANIIINLLILISIFVGGIGLALIIYRPIAVKVFSNANQGRTRFTTSSSPPELIVLDKKLTALAKQVNEIKTT